MALAATLWWVLFSHPGWIRYLPDTDSRLIGRTVDRIYRARLQVPSADANENGTPDWYETSRGFDPRTNNVFQGMVRVHNRFPYRGERTPLRLVHDVSGRFPDASWPINTEVTIKATTPILLAADAPVGTPPTKGPLRVKLSQQGRLVFDVLMFDDQSDEVWITHARSGISLTQGREQLFRAYGWRLAVQPSRADPLFVETFDAAPFGPSQIGPMLVWKPHPDPRVSYILEAARPDAPNEWIGFDRIERSGAYEQLLSYKDREVFPNYPGAFLYRVIAISAKKPAVPDL